MPRGSSRWRHGDTVDGASNAPEPVPSPACQDPQRVRVAAHPPPPRLAAQESLDETANAEPDADRERIRELVYLDAAHPRDGESLEIVAPAQMEPTRAMGRTVDGIELDSL